MVIVALLNIYYIVILAWAVFYLFQSFTLDLAWAKCNQAWNTPCCVETFSKNVSANLTTMTTTLAATTATSSLNLTVCNGSKTSPETEFWESVTKCSPQTRNFMLKKDFLVVIYSNRVWVVLAFECCHSRLNVLRQLVSCSQLH